MEYIQSFFPDIAQAVLWAGLIFGGVVLLVLLCYFIVRVVSAVQQMARRNQRRMLVLVFVLVCTSADAQYSQIIYLRSCVELNLVLLSDHSSSMSGTQTDLCNWAQGMTLVPVG